MRYDYSSPAGNDLLGWGRPRSSTIRTLLILNLGIWGILTLTGFERPMFSIFGLVPKSMLTGLMPSQPPMFPDFWLLAPDYCLYHSFCHLDFPISLLVHWVQSDIIKIYIASVTAKLFHLYKPVYPAGPIFRVTMPRPAEIFLNTKMAV